MQNDFQMAEEIGNAVLEQLVGLVLAEVVVKNGLPICNYSA